MTSSPAPGSRLVDYFFIAGIKDHQILSTYHSTRDGRQDDDLYYHRQQIAIQPNNNSRPPNNLQRDGSFGVLDHVQAVIDHFDKERDHARNTVIAVHDQECLAEKYNMAGGPGGRHRSASANESSRKPVTAGKRQRQYSEPPPAWMKSSENHTSTTTTTTSLSAPQSIPNILDIKYPPAILSRYPNVHQPSFPPYTAMFCFPKDISLFYGDIPPPEQLHSFTMTDENGGSVHGTCVIFYEPLVDKLVSPVDDAIQEWVKENMPPSTIEYAQHLKIKINEEKAKLAQHGAELASLTTLTTTAAIKEQRQELEELVRSAQENLTLYTELLEPVKMGVCEARHVWVPKSVGLVGCMPWHDLYGDWLRILVDAVVGVRGHKNDGPVLKVESVVSNIIHHVPLPPPGRFEIGLTINNRPLYLSRPPINQVPLLKNFSLYPVFRALSPHLILAIIETLLAEGKVLFLSQYPGMLSIACETFRYLLFPLYWQFVFIPVLPQRLLTCLQAPVPYIVGFPGDMEDVEEYVSEDTCIVNLDSNSMHSHKQSSMLPERQRRKLYAALDQYAPLHGARYRIPYGIPLPVREMFPNSRMLLSCGRSKIQSTYDNSISRDSDVSDTTRHLSSLWSTSSRSSNDSSTSLPTSLDVPTPMLPQYPGNAKLATLSQASNSSSSLHTPPMSPTVSKSRLQRSSMTVQRHGSTSSQPHTTSKAHGEEDNKPKRRLSTFIPKPRAALQNESDFPPPPPPPAASSTARVSMYSSHAQNGYEYNRREAIRRVKHIEGHIMTQVLSRELASLQGYRCLCGKQVADVVQADDRPRQSSTFMRCQECHLVTHEECAEQILHPCLPACFNERKVQEAFLRTFASLFYNYRIGFVDDPQEVNGPALASTGDYSTKLQKGVLYFSKEKFLKHADKDSRSYLSQLVDSQMFTQFITDRLSKPRNDPEVLLFDEFIKLKLNRSKLKFVKEDTPFLNDDSFNISQTIWATPPSDTSVESYDRFPIDLELSE